MKRFSFILIYFTYSLLISCNKKENSVLNANIFQEKTFENSSPTSKINFLDSLNKVSATISNDSVGRNFLFELSTEYYNLNQNRKSLNVCIKVLQFSKAANDTLSIAKSYSYIGDTHGISRKDSAYYYYQKAEKLYQILKNRKYIGKMLVKKAYILFYAGNYIEGEVQVSNALIYLKESTDAELLFSAYTLMGANFEKLEEFQDALKYQLLAKSVLSDIQKSKIHPEEKYFYHILSSINLANIYEKTAQYKKSIRELELILSNKLKESLSQKYATAIGNLAYSKMKSGQLDGVKQLFEEALSISIKNGTDSNTIYKLLNLGEYYSIVRDTSQSVKFLKKSLQLAEKLKVGDEIKESLKFLSRIDYQNAPTYDKRYIIITDSLDRVQRISRNKYARIEYETSVVTDENKSLNTKNNYILITSLFLIFVLVLALIYRYLQSQKSEILFRITQQKAEEEIFSLLKEYQVKLTEAKELEQNRISKELHDSVMNKLYGARLQLGILNESDDKEAKQKRLLYVDLLQKIEQEIRTISHDLHTEAIDAQFDYISLLTNLIQQQNEIGTTIFILDVNKKIEWNTIESLVKLTIFRILQESALNVTKHAKATQCKVSIKTSTDETKLILTIKDNGKGFAVSDKTLGIGLKNIKDRVSRVNAELLIKSSPMNGAFFKITFFIKKNV